LLVFRKAFTRFDFTGDCQQTRVELCACTSDHEHSTRAGEACTCDRQPVNGNPDSYSHSWTWPKSTSCASDHLNVIEITACVSAALFCCSLYGQSSSAFTDYMLYLCAN